MVRVRSFTRDDLLAVVLRCFDRFGEKSFAAGSERDVNNASIMLAFFAPDDAQLFEGSDEPGNSRRGEAKLLREVETAQFAARTLMQMEKDHKIVETEAAGKTRFEAARQQSAEAGEIDDGEERLAAFRLLIFH